MLAPEFLPVLGGVGTYIVELVRHLPRSVEIHVVTPRRIKLGKEKISSEDYVLSEYFKSNIHTHFVSRASDTFVYNAAFQYACMRYIPRFLKEQGIDLIHSHTAHMPDILLQWKRPRIPTITTVHTTIQGQRAGTQLSGMGFSKLGFSEKMTYALYPLLRTAEKIYLSKAKKFIFVSKWMRDQLQEQYPKRNFSSAPIVYNSVDVKQFSPDEFSSNEKDKRDMVLFTGRMTAAKGAVFLTRAIPEVIREFPDVVFTFIGPGNSRVYEEMLRKRGISATNYLFLGYLKESHDLIKYYRTAAIYVAPTLYENLPIRILEAMACETPVVASSVCAIPEIIESGENGLLVPPGSPNKLAQSICMLLGDPGLRRRMGRSARRIVERKFSWEQNAQKTYEIYERVLVD